MNEEKIQEQENNNSVSLRIAQTMASVKKISERDKQRHDVYILSDIPLSSVPKVT